jgi:hypothetical protein
MTGATQQVIGYESETAIFLSALSVSLMLRVGVLALHHLNC